MARRILVVEDSPTQAETVRRHLVEAGFDVTVASDGVDALQRLENNGDAFSLVLSDVIMPEVDGFELCSRIKAETDHADLPVVLLTSLSNPQDIIRGLEVGADHFLTKPYDPEDLISRLESILENRALRQSGQFDVGVEVTFLGRHFTITRERQQIVALLVSTFENLIQTNTRLLERESELADARDDIADQLRHTEHERARLETVLMTIPDAVVITDPTGVVTDVNPAAEQLLERTSESACGTEIHRLGRLLDNRGREVPRDDRPVYRTLRGGELVQAPEDFTFVGPGDRRVPVSITAAPITDTAGGIRAGVVVMRDISLAALHDPITQLPNRVLFGDRVQHALVHPDRNGHSVIVAQISLDQFGDIRSSLGQDAADELLIIASKRIARRLRPEATLARTGPGEFSVLLEGVSEVSDAVQAITRAVAVFERPVTIATEELYVTTSTGVAIAGAQARDAETLLLQSRTAMTRAMDRESMTVEMFDPSLNDIVLERLRLERDLHLALSQDEFVVHYQPIVALDTGMTVDAEALVRWEHPQRGLVPPGEFIPVAERSGMIVPIGLWVLREACRQTVTWQRDGIVSPDFGISVNLSARQFADPELVALVTAILDETGLAGEALTLEVTETAVMDDRTVAVGTLNSLRALGIKIAIDDFGTGHSSLGYLMDLPVDILKIDRSFIEHIPTDPARSAITESAILLGRRLEHVVVAEGIETHDQIAWLRALGCERAAGFLLARPAPATELAPLLGKSLISA